jgi:hypothetical protein
MATIADIQTEARALVDADTTSYPAALMLIRNNTAMEEIASLILGADGRWQWDDKNNTDFPEGTTTLVSGQADYTLDTTYIKIDGVSVKDVAGRWYRLLPFDPEDLKATYGPFLDRAQFLNTSGRPLFYDIQGNSIILYPAPDAGVTVTLASGLKVFAQRTAQLFTSAEVITGTKAPGFASPFHSLISYMSALPYAMAYKPQRVQFLMAEIARKKAELVRFYGHRDKDERPRITMAPIIFK